MDEGPSLRLLCGDELGYVRTVQAATAQRLSAASVVARWGDGRRANGVSRLALSDGGEEAECCLLAGAAAGSLRQVRRAHLALRSRARQR